MDVVHITDFTNAVHCINHYLRYNDLAEVESGTYLNTIGTSSAIIKALHVIGVLMTRTTDDVKLYCLNIDMHLIWNYRDRMLEYNPHLFVPTCL